MDTLDSATSMEQAMMERAERFNIPLTGSMELLPLCNMNCNMCYVRLSRAEMEARGRMRTGAEWLALGGQMARAGTLFLLLTGGEPLLHPDFREIYLGLKKLGMILTINTNATLIDEQWAAFFGKHKPRRINITLYGADRAAYEKLCHHPDGFDRVIRAVHLLRQNDVPVKLSCSVTPENVQDLDAMFQIAEQLGVPMRMDTYMMPARRERNSDFSHQSRLLPEQAAQARIHALRSEMGEDLFRQFAVQTAERVESFQPKEAEPCRISCHAGKCSFTVNWQGMLRPCVVLTEPEINVFEVPFEQGWKRISEQFLQVRFCGKCSACELRPVCRTCAAAAKLETGSFLGTPEYLCRYAKESIRILRDFVDEFENE